jgi:pimeloyl-ACP methyl ester carboxylesterase
MINMKQLYFFLAILATASCNSEFSKSKNNPSAGYVTVGNSKLYYEISGNGDPVLFAHAGFMDHTMWDGQVKEFVNNGHKVIRIDLPSHALSSDADTNVFIPDYFITLLNHLKIDKATLVGLSLGGASVIDFALEHPDKVNKLVLVSSLAAGFQPLRVDSMIVRYGPEITNAKTNEEAATVFTRYWGVGLRDQNELNKKIYNYVYETAVKSITEHGYRKWARFKDPQDVKRVSELKMPVLIIHADKDLAIISEGAERFDSLIKNSTVVLMKGPAHMLNMEKPDEFNRIVLDFLKK